METAEITFADRLAEHKLRLRNYLAGFLDRGRPQSLYEPIHYMMDGDGKRLRPILVLLGAEALHGDVEKAVPVAAAIELLHNFTLVHDDIMDRDDTRRGRPTVHQKWDVSIALLAGDGLVAKAYESLLSCDSPRILEMSKLFTRGIIELCEGQALDLEFERRENVSMDEYFEMIRKKTACLLSMSAQMGGLVADAQPWQLQSLERFAESLGIAFQVQDDLLDITADEKELGKDFGSDIKQHKKTFMLIHALKHANNNQRLRLRENFFRQEITRKQINSMKEIFDEIGTFVEARRVVQSYIAQAENSLEKLDEHADASGLRALLNLVLMRKA